MSSAQNNDWHSKGTHCWLLLFYYLGIHNTFPRLPQHNYLSWSTKTTNPQGHNMSFSFTLHLYTADIATISCKLVLSTKAQYKELGFKKYLTPNPNSKICYFALGRYLTFLCFNFLNCKVRIIATSQGNVRPNDTNTQHVWFIADTASILVPFHFFPQ